MTRSAFGFYSTFVCACLGIASIFGTAFAAGPAVIHNFGNNFTSDTYVPFDTVTAIGTALFGVGRHGGGHRAGGIFRISTDGSGYQVIHGFDPTLGEGDDAYDGLSADGTTLYGVTRAGGATDGGTLYMIDSAGGGFQVLHSFDNAAGEPRPHGRLTVDGPVLYGMTQYGGSADKGAIYTINADGTGFALLHSFGSVANDGTLRNGLSRGSWLKLSGNTLYGVTPTGGSTTGMTGGVGYGTVFKMNTNGSGYAILHHFSVGPLDGANPYGSVTLVGGVLYGMAGVGGSKNAGVVYKINTDGTGYKILHNFHSVAHDGTQPSGELFAVGATLYGITQAGGLSAPGGYNGEGTLFKVNTDGSGYTILHHFGVTTDDGESPNVGVVYADGAFFGVTSDGGANRYNATGFSYSGTGTIYKLSPDLGALTVTVTPPTAVSAGAQWQVDGGAWQNSGDTVPAVLTGSHVINFSPVAGYTVPGSQTVTVSVGKTLSIIGAYTSPTLSVQQPAGTVLANGAATAEFGSAKVGSHVMKAFTLKNTGLATMTTVAATIEGDQNGDFVVTTFPLASLAPKASTILNITFTPSGLDRRTAVLHITSDDPVTPSFDIPIGGEGVTTPRIDVPPTSQLLELGTSLALSTTASGGGLSHQWLRNGVVIKGVTTSNYDIASTSLSHAGTYQAKILNVADTIVSPAANIGFVSLSPRLVTAVEGGTLTLSVVAAAPGIKYQWQRGGTDLVDGVNPLNAGGTIRGATTPRLTITRAVVADAGSYSCRITMPDPQAPTTPLEMESGVFTAKVVIRPVINAFSPEQWIVGGTVTDIVTALNEPTSFKLKGQPTGVSLDASGHFHGKPRVTITHPTVYHLVITASNAKGVSEALIVDVTVLPLPEGTAGSFTGPVIRSGALNSDLGGSFSPVITLAGAISGNLVLGAKRYAVVGVLETPLTGNAKAFINVPKTSITVAFEVDGATASLVSGELSDGAHQAAFRGWRKLWGTEMRPEVAAELNRYTGYHTFALKPPSGQPTLPQGAGFGSVNVAARTGAVTVSGRLADGSVFITKTFCGPAGEVLVYRTLYGSRGSVVGRLNIDLGSGIPLADNDTLGGDVSWLRPAIRGRVYPDGFGPTDLTVIGGRYSVPIAPALVLGINDDGIAYNASLRFTGADIVNVPPDVDFRLKSGSAFVKPPASSNERNTTFKVADRTGYVSGGFVLTDMNPVVGIARRPATYFAQIVRDTDLVMRGYGFFLLADQPELPGENVSNTPQRSGQVIFEKLP